MTKRIIVYFPIIIICIVIMIMGAIFDNHCETLLGVLAIISGWIALAMCGYGIACSLMGIEI
jgi:hypothetical protein